MRRSAVTGEVLAERAGRGEAVGADRVDAAELGPGHDDDRQAGAGSATTSSATVRPSSDHPVDPPGEVAHGGVGVGPAVGGQDEHAAAEPRRGLLVPEQHLGVVRARQVGEDDPVGGVRALRRARCPRGWGGSRAPRRRRAPGPGWPRRRAPTRAGPGRRSRSRRRRARRRRRSSPCPARCLDGVGSAFMWRPSHHPRSCATRARPRDRGHLAPCSVMCTLSPQVSAAIAEAGGYRRNCPETRRARTRLRTASGRRYPVRVCRRRPRGRRADGGPRVSTEGIDDHRTCARPPDRHRRVRRRDPRPGAAVRGAGPEAGRVPAHPRHPRPPPHGRRARHVLGHVVGALLVQVEQEPPAPVRRQDHRRHEGAPARRHRRERGRRRHRRRLGGHVQGRVAQPPVLRRAVPGRGHGRRRHRARHHLDGRAPGRGHGPAALRRRRPPRHRPRGARRRGRRRRLRQLPRPAQHRRRARVRRLLPGQPAGQRAVPGRAAARGHPPGQRLGRGQQGGPVRCAHGRRRHRRRVDPGVRDVRRHQALQAPVGAGGRPVHGEGAHRVLPRALRRARGRGHPGPGRRRHLLRDQRAGLQRRRRHARRPGERAAARPHR